MLYFLITIACFEVSLWILGYRPYQHQLYKMYSVPSNPYIGHDNLGIALNPGEYEITINEGLTFQATHLPSGIRKTRNTPIESDQNIHFLGCSFTYGYGVNDEQTFASKIQKVQADKKIINHGVVGYGTAQNYLQLQSLNLDSGDIVILCLSSEHLKRNTLSPAYRKHLKLGFENSSDNLSELMNGARFPYLSSCDSIISYEDWFSMYTNYRGRNWFSSVNFVQTLVDEFQEDLDNQISVTTCLLKRMYSKCNEQDVDFKVVCLDTSEETKKIQQDSNEIPWLNIDFDFGNADYTNAPFDTHPNESGHQLIANKVLEHYFNE